MDAAEFTSRHHVRPVDHSSLPSGTGATSQVSHASSKDRDNHSYWTDILQLTKPEISFLVTLSAAGGFLLASGTQLNLTLLFHTLLGTFLTAAGSGMLNHYVEREEDGQMRRTARRPIPDGRISEWFAFLGGIALTASGVGYLATQVNMLTGGLGLLTAASYLLIYTPLKQVTSYNTLIGCVPGAIPPLGGWTAATGMLEWEAFLLFAVLFTWQMPHFLSLAWMYRSDYARAGFQMLPVVEPDGRSTGLQTLLFTALLVIASFLPGIADLVGWLYLAGAIVLGIYVLVPAFRFYRSLSNQDARWVLQGSIVYIPALVGLIFLDRFLI